MGNTVCESLSTTQVHEGTHSYLADRPPWHSQPTITQTTDSSGSLGENTCQLPNLGQCLYCATDGGNKAQFRRQTSLACSASQTKTGLSSQLQRPRASMIRSAQITQHAGHGGSATLARSLPAKSSCVQLMTAVNLSPGSDGGSTHRSASPYSLRRRPLVALAACSIHWMACLQPSFTMPV